MKTCVCYHIQMHLHDALPLFQVAASFGEKVIIYQPQMIQNVSSEVVSIA